MGKILNNIISNPLKRQNLENRYWPKIAKTGFDDCWLWIAKAKHTFGYGKMTAGRGVHLKAHQIAWALENGVIPDNKNVLHKCDVPQCCNPNHLFLGTHADNVNDMKNKGRGSNPPVHYGENHHNVTISNDQIIEIKNSKKTQRELAEFYKVSSQTIWRIKNNKTRVKNENQ